MKKANYILEELNIISPLISKIQNEATYSIPPDYFNNLFQDILAMIGSGKEHAYLSGLSTPFSIPEDYFENLAELILKKVATTEKKFESVFQELEDIAPLLNTLSKKPLFHTPATFPEKITVPAAVEVEKQPKIGIRNRLKLMRFAAAAVIIPSIAVAIYSITAREFKMSRNNNSNAKSAIKHLTKAEIITFLRNSTSIRNTTSAVRNTSKNDHTLKSSLQQIPDKDIQQFLKETGDSDEI